MALLKQERAYGVGMGVATQNPMDLDDRALSNAGLWFVGRLQTDADRARVVEGMADATEYGSGPGRVVLSATTKKLAKRWFVMQNVHAKEVTNLVNPRYAISWMQGPLTRVELRTASEGVCTEVVGRLRRRHAATWFEARERQKSSHQPF